MANAPRSTATRDLHRKQIRRGQPPCSICGEAIDYLLPYLDPYEFVVDHVVPLSKGGADALENKAAAHRVCNRAKSDRTEGVDVRVFVTDRSW